MTLVRIRRVSDQGMQFSALTDGPLQRLRVCLLRQLDAAAIHGAGAPVEGCAALL